MSSYTTETLRSSDSLSDMINITQPICSADGCGGIPCVPCPRCLLLSYCDNACRERHWPKHKRDCAIEFDNPATSEAAVKKDSYELRSFWSCYAATDIFNLEKNEGRYYDSDLDLLLTGDSSLRHFIYSIVKMPETASPTMFVALNEPTNVHLTRTFLALSLLTAQDYDPVLNAEAVIHMWYSAKLPRLYLDHIRSVVAVNTGNAIDEITAGYLVEADARSERIRVNWCVNNTSVDVDVVAAKWLTIRDHLKPLATLSDKDCTIIRFTDLARHTEPAVRYLARMTHSRALGVRKWQNDGLLLPYGHPREDFDIPNPIFFRNSESFPVGASAEPLCEWPMELLDYEDCPAPNDVYGKMFYYLRDLLVEFQKRISQLSVSFRLTCEIMNDLASWNDALQFERPFDRIEVGYHFDIHPFLTLTAASTLLRHEDENPFATLLTVTQSAVSHDLLAVRKELENERQDMFRPNDTFLDELAPPLAEGTSLKTRDASRRKLGLVMWRNWDRFATRYLHSPVHFAFGSLMMPSAQIEHRSVIQTGFLGLALRDKHMIVRRWPNRLIHSRKDKPSPRDFNRVVGWPMPAPQRWLEWKRCGDISLFVWNEWMKVATSMSPLTVTNTLESLVAGHKYDDADESSRAGTFDSLLDSNNNASRNDQLEELTVELDQIDIDPSETINKKKKSKKSKGKK